MSLSILGASFLGNLLTDKGVKAKTPGKRVMRAIERTLRASQDF